MTSGLDPEALEGRRVLAVMAKSLVRGTVKTRLAAQIGEDAALAVYERLLLGTLAQAESIQDVDLVLAAATPGGATGRAAGPSHDAPPVLAGSPSDPLAGRSAPLASPRAARRHARRPPRRRLRRSLRRRRRIRRRSSTATARPSPSPTSSRRSRTSRLLHLPAASSWARPPTAATTSSGSTRRRGRPTATPSSPCSPHRR